MAAGDLVDHEGVPHGEHHGLAAQSRSRAPQPRPAAAPGGLWYDKAYPDDNLFLTLARRPAVLELFLGWVAFAYTGVATLDPKLVELCRLRLATRNHCVH